jgi:hypothetical protein
MSNRDDLFMAEAEGFRTMVGFSNKGEPPYESGNCFGVYRQKVTRDDVISGSVTQYKIVNFNADNLDALLKLGLKWPIQCKVLLGRIAIIHDPRIGERWYSNRYCETCCPTDLLPITQIQRHERETMRGDREEGDGFVKLRIPFRPPEFP